MKNLKRALSLVLSTAMLLGMMVVGTGASYNDVTSEHNEEAIAVMEAAGIMEGDGNGFNPDNKVTRHEMAVVMANLLDLNVEDFNGAETPFTDVAAWAAPYVAACYADGIMAGTSATTFGGAANVTAAQAALMMMKALGYFQFQPDFGEDWQLATVKQASKIDLFDGMKVGATTELTRNEVAQMALNALESDMVDYSGSQGTDIKLADGTSILTGYTIKYDSIWINNEGAANYAGAAAGADGLGYQQLCEELYDTDLKKFDTSDDFGRSATEWKFKTEGLGKYAKEADAVYADKATKAALYTLAGKDVVDDLNDATKPAAVLTVWVDGVAVQNPAVADYFVKNNTASIGATALTGNGTSTEVFIDSDTNAVNVVIINTYVVKASADYSAKRESVNIAMKSDNAPALNAGETTLKAEDFDVENVEKDDYLLITIAAGDIKSVKPATILTGEVNSYKTGDNVSLDGTTYKYAFKAKTDNVNGKNVTYAIGEEAKVVTDGTYIIYVDEATVAADHYVFIKDIAANGNFADADLIAQAIFLDGTAKVIDLKDETFAGRTLVATNGVDEGWYAYSVNSENVYTLTDLGARVSAKMAWNAAAPNTLAAGTVLTQTNNIALYGTAAKANADTIFVVVDDDDDITVYTGVTNAPDVTAGAASVYSVVTNTNGNIAKYVFIDADNGAIDAAKDSEDFIYILKADGTGVDADKNAVYFYKAIVNGEETTITSNIAATPDQLYTDVKYDEAGYVDAMNLVDANDDFVVVNNVAKIAYGPAVVDYEGGVLSIGATDYVVDSDCEIYMIARDANIREDGAANYELTTGISADALKGILNGYTVSGDYFAKCDDDTGALLALYIVIGTTV